MAKLTSVTWSGGQSHIVIALPKGRLTLEHSGAGFDEKGYPKNYHTVATNNGEQWSYFLSIKRLPALMSLLSLVDESQANTERMAGALYHLVPAYRFPLEWAKKDTAKRKKNGTLEFDKVYSTEALDLLSKEALPLSNGDEATYEGFDSVSKKSSHSLEALHEQVDLSILRAKSIWGWSPTRPQIKFHDKSKAFGLAYDPGGGVHVISLHARLLSDYNADSIFRVIIHEWCHHYRDEKFIRSRDPHDAKFCELLGQADPTVEGNLRACTFFTDIKDPAIATLKKKKSSRKDPVWTPEAGDIEIDHLKSGPYNINWVPNKGKGFTWSKFSFKLDTTGSFMLFAKNFALEDWIRVRVLLTSRISLRIYTRVLSEGNYSEVELKGKPALLTNLAVLANMFARQFRMTDLGELSIQAFEIAKEES